MIKIDAIHFDLDTATVDHLGFILRQEDILNSDKIILVRDIITQEDKVKSALSKFSIALDHDLTDRLGELARSSYRRFINKGNKEHEA